MTTPNIKRFNELTGLILATLYEHFPEPILLNGELVGIAVPEYQQDSTGGMVAASPHSADENFSTTRHVGWVRQDI